MLDEAMPKGSTGYVNEDQVFMCRRCALFRTPGGRVQWQHPADYHKRQCSQCGTYFVGTKPMPVAQSA